MAIPSLVKARSFPGLCALFIASITLSLGTANAADKPAYIAIIIDDLGYNIDRGKRAINLPGSVTFAVLPYSHFARPLSEHAHTLNKEVIIHLPMESTNLVPTEPDALTDMLSKRDFLSTIETAISRVPYAQGINNHQGSHLTQQTEQMTWLMEEIKDRRFFFLDSRTTPDTVAYEIAQEKNVLSGSRDVFLDNERTHYEIDRAFRELIRTAKKKGTAIGIGHPHSKTLEYLEMAIPLLRQENIILLPVSSLMALQQIKQSVNKKLAEKAGAKNDGIRAASFSE